MRRTLAINLVIVVVLLALVEAASWATLQWHARNRTAALPADPQARTTAGVLEQRHALYSSPDIRRDLDALKAAAPGPYRYQNYLLFQNRAFSSNHVNVDRFGARAGLSRFDRPEDGVDHEIWMFGSSALFGVSNGDSETIPSYLQRHLEKLLPGRRFRVVNFGVVGYTSWQDLANLKLRLIQSEPPDMVIAFNGVNDHYVLWSETSRDCTHLLRQNFGNPLYGYFDAHAAGDFVNWGNVSAATMRMMPHTVRLAELGGKWLRLRSSRASPEQWRSQYRMKRDERRALSARCEPRSIDTFVRNMRGLADTAKQAGASVVFIQQPMIFDTSKPLVAGERSEYEHPMYNFFALDDGALSSLAEIPTFRLEQPFHWTLTDFVDGYRRQDNAYRALASSVGAQYVDARAAVDAAGDAYVFSSQVHYTFTGAEVVGRHVAERLAPRLREQTPDRRRRGPFAPLHIPALLPEPASTQ